MILDSLEFHPEFDNESSTMRPCKSMPQSLASSLAKEPTRDYLVEAEFCLEHAIPTTTACDQAK
jgi:hypothetical protein